MKKKTEELSFTYESVLQEIDKFRKPMGYENLDDKQRAFLLKCREGACPVAFSNMAKLWKKVPGWPPVGEAVLKSWCYRLQGLK